MIRSGRATPLSSALGPWCFLAGILGSPLAGQRTATGPTVSTMTLSAELPSMGRLGGLSTDRDGAIYVSNFGSGVWRVTPAGEVVPLTSALRAASGNAIDNDGNLLQSDYTRDEIVKIHPSGHVTTVVRDGLAGPLGVAVDTRDQIYVCNCRDDSIAKIAPHGSVERFVTSPLLECPNGVTIVNDDLYVVNFSNEFVVKITPDGSVEGFAVVPDGGNAHIAFANDALYVTKSEANKVYRVTMTGQVKRFAGTGEAGFVDGPAEWATLSHPNGIAAAPDGRTLYVNTLDGAWRSNESGRIAIRRIHLITP